MTSDLLTKWTAIITNIAVVIGLAFVGLEFRNNTRAIEAERIDSFIGANADINSPIVENENFSEIVLKAHTDPDSLTGNVLNRIQEWMVMHYDSFRRQRLAHQAGLLSDGLYEEQKDGIGFVFSSNLGLELIDLFRASALDNEVWEAIDESAQEARKYCLNTSNKCMERYEGMRASVR
jgi:hypothetical protein